MHELIAQHPPLKLPDAIEEQNESSPIASNHDKQRKGPLALLQQPQAAFHSQPEHPLESFVKLFQFLSLIVKNKSINDFIHFPSQNRI